MASKEKMIKNTIYHGLGFPIQLQNASFQLVQGEWTPKIDLEKLALIAFKELPKKPSKLTGNEIKFIRTYLDKSKPAFANIFKLSHTAIAKWENVGDNPAPISPSQEMVLRLYLEDYLKVGEKEFYRIYKSVESAIYVEEETPLKIAF